MTTSTDKKGMDPVLRRVGSISYLRVIPPLSSLQYHTNWPLWFYPSNNTAMEKKASKFIQYILHSITPCCSPIQYFWHYVIIDNCKRHNVLQMYWEIYCILLRICIIFQFLIRNVFFARVLFLSTENNWIMNFLKDRYSVYRTKRSSGVPTD